MNLAVSDDTNAIGHWAMNQAQLLAVHPPTGDMTSSQVTKTLTS